MSTRAERYYRFSDISRYFEVSISRYFVVNYRDTMLYITVIKNPFVMTISLLLEAVNDWATSLEQHSSTH